jgi:hypothetical protein
VDVRSGGRWLPLAAIASLLGAAMLAAVVANPVIDTRPLETSGQDGASQQVPTLYASATGSAQPAPAFQLPSWTIWLATAGCLALALLLVGLLVVLVVRDRLARRRPPVPLPLEPGAPDITEARRGVRAAVDQGLSDLDDDSDPRRAIIACWVRLEQVAGAAGVERSVSDTPTDLVVRLLETHLVVDAVVLAQLADLYREARYAEHAVDEAMRLRARAALGRLQTDLAGPRRPAPRPAREAIR